MAENGNNENLIQIQSLTKQFPMGGRKFTALDRITLDFGRGDFAGLVGPSGSGKTTLLNIMGALDAPSEGTARVLGQDTKTLRHKQAARLRNLNLGFIFQTFNLLPVYSVFENVEFPLLLLKKPAAERHEAVMDALEWVGLTDKAQSRPAQLSGGECQRVAVARAMVKKPPIVLADEPTANLDAKNSYNILDMMVTLNTEFKTTFIFATHDEKVIRYLKRVVTLTDGRVIKDEQTTPKTGK